MPIPLATGSVILHILHTIGAIIAPVIPVITTANTVTPVIPPRLFEISIPIGVVTDFGNKEIIRSLFKLNIFANKIIDKTLKKHPIVMPIIIGMKFFLSNDNCF